jgi:hypothetical protein
LVRAVRGVPGHGDAAVPVAGPLGFGVVVWQDSDMRRTTVGHVGGLLKSVRTDDRAPAGGKTYND